MEFYSTMFDLIITFDKLIYYNISSSSNYAKNLINEIKTEFMSELIDIVNKYTSYLKTNSTTVYYFYGEKYSKMYDMYSSLLLKLKFLEIISLFNNDMKKQNSDIDEEINNVENYLKQLKNEGQEIKHYFDNIEIELEKLFADKI